MKELVNLLKALADKNRIRILKLLEAKKLCVCELAYVLGITQPSVSRHLKKLIAAGIIAKEQDHFWTNYYLKSGNKPADSFFSCFKKCLNESPIIKKDMEKLRKVNRAKLCK